MGHEMRCETSPVHGHVARTTLWEKRTSQAASVRQAKPGASSGWDSRPGKGRANPPGTESWAHAGNDMG